MAKLTLEGAITSTTQLIEFTGTNDLICWERAKASCIQKYNIQYGSQGYKNVSRLCPSCSAYYHFAMARNALFSCKRMRGEVEVEDGRSAR